jgi:hypothetical protein
VKVLFDCIVTKDPIHKCSSTIMFIRAVAKMLEKAGVEIFSVGDITGYKKRGYNVGWFGSDNGKTNSIVMFSFTSAESAHRAIEIIEECNECNQSRFPVRAYILNVDEFLKVE